MEDAINNILFISPQSHVGGNRTSGAEVQKGELLKARISRAFIILMEAILTYNEEENNGIY